MKHFVFDYLYDNIYVVNAFVSIRVRIIITENVSLSR